MRSLRIDNTELEIKERDLKGEFVSHYTSVKTLIEYILPSQQLKFSTLEKLNDPYEYRVDLGVISVSGDLNIDKSFSPRAIEFIRQNIKIFCTSKSSKFDLHFRHAPITKCSFGNVMMWAQYSENHKGVSLLFDRKKLESILKGRFDHVFIENVKYTDVSQSQINTVKYDGDDFFENIISELKNNRKTRFFTKQEEWKAEKEIRYLVMDKNEEGDEFVDFGSSLKAIFLGDRTPEVYEMVISELLQGTEIGLFKLSWDHIYKNSFVMKCIKEMSSTIRLGISNQK